MQDSEGANCEDSLNSIGLYVVPDGAKDLQELVANILIDRVQLIKFIKKENYPTIFRTLPGCFTKK